jgi:murein DD-endopeptidase MepM/ murein hydrolase activator NlpD
MTLPLDAMWGWPRARDLRFGFVRRPASATETEHRHQGVDLAAPTGTPVRAAAAGRVVLAVNEPRFLALPNGRRRQVWRGYGRVVVVEHAPSELTLYAHLNSLDVHEGQMVEEGQQIGTVGRTAWRPPDLDRLTRAPHLHFETLTRFPPRPERDRLDPEPWLEARGETLPFRRAPRRGLPA